MGAPRVMQLKQSHSPLATVTVLADDSEEDRIYLLQWGILHLLRGGTWEIWLRNLVTTLFGWFACFSGSLFFSFIRSDMGKDSSKHGSQYYFSVIHSSNSRSSLFDSNYSFVRSSLDSPVVLLLVILYPTVHLRIHFDTPNGLILDSIEETRWCGSVLLSCVDLSASSSYCVQLPTPTALSEICDEMFINILIC